MGILDFLYSDLAIDLGTANTVIISKGKIVVDEPSIIAIDKNTNKVIAIGREAMQMHEKTHENIKTIKPLKDGVIANYQAAELMIRGMIKMVNNSKWKLFNPLFHRMVICIPSGITDVEKRAVKDSAEHTGAKEVYMIYEPIAAAIGIGINIEEPKGSMIVDIGGGTTEIAVIALAGIICNQSIRVAGDVFNTDILEYMRKQHNLLIGERTAEKIKIAVGAAQKDIDNPPDDLEVRGRDLMSGIPKVITVNYQEIIPALDKSISKIEEAILKALEESPPELSADIYEAGIYLTGGGALLRGLDKRLAQKTKLAVHVAENPLQAVVRGTGVALKNLEAYKSVLMT
ncbi:MAG: rod shape-determining protein [Candidatus Amoebophilus sp. 36-38]|nr:MAG: rod shape-determining protein [Candidatus Amoebophilus sp. 36-38]